MKFFSVLVFLICSYEIKAQRVTVAADRMNVLYIGLGNSITVTAENCACNQLVVKTTNGKLVGKGCEYLFWGKKPGPAEISVYKFNKNKLTKLGHSAFRLKNLPPPIFKIGPYGGNNSDSVNILLLKTQEYVRGELENFDIDARFNIDSFNAKIVYVDSCHTKTIFNKSNKIGNELKAAFSLLRIGDIVIFDMIYAKGLDGNAMKLAPLVLRLAKEK